MIEIAAVVGMWCLAQTVDNGYSTELHRKELPTNIYERKADCSPDRRVMITRRSLRGLEFEVQDNGWLVVQGWPKQD